MTEDAAAVQDDAPDETAGADEAQAEGAEEGAEKGDDEGAEDDAGEPGDAEPGA